jgi:hypothetical protein
MVTPSRQCGRGSWVRCDGPVPRSLPTCWSAGCRVVGTTVHRSTAAPHPVHRISPVGPQMPTPRTELYRKPLTDRSGEPGPARAEDPQVTGRAGSPGCRRRSWTGTSPGRPGGRPTPRRRRPRRGSAGRGEPGGRGGRSAGRRRGAPRRCAGAGCRDGHHTRPHVADPVGGPVVVGGRLAGEGGTQHGPGAGHPAGAAVPGRSGVHGPAIDGERLDLDRPRHPAGGWRRTPGGTHATPAAVRAG